MSSTRLLEQLLTVNIAKEERFFKSLEKLTESRVEPPFVLRLDGVGFGRRLEGFNKPRDPRVHDALIDACKVLMDELGGDACYTGSDEINLVMLANLPYSGRVEKLVSVSAGIASSIVSLKLSRPLFFDSRVIPLGSMREVRRYLVYRARIVLNNFVNSMLAVLGVRVERLKGGLLHRIRLLASLGVRLLDPPWAWLGSCVAPVSVERLVGEYRVERRRFIVLTGPYCPLSSNDTR